MVTMLWSLLWGFGLHDADLLLECFGIIQVLVSVHFYFFCTLCPPLQIIGCGHNHFVFQISADVSINVAPRQWVGRVSLSNSKENLKLLGESIVG